MNAPFRRPPLPHALRHHLGYFRGDDPWAERREGVVMTGVDGGATSTVARGRRAEAIAALYLELGGYRLIARNARCGPLEVDLIAARGDTIAFVEVRARSSRAHGAPEESVRRRKQGRVTRAAERLFETGDLPPGARVRFDVIAIDIEPFGLRLRHRLGYWHPR